MMSGYRCRVLADSLSPGGVRLATLELRYPLMIHAEFLTHRSLSRNSRSSRATPISQMVREVNDDPAMPARWTRNGKGMVAPGDIDEPHRATEVWIRAAETATRRVGDLSYYGCHKQVANRLLAPFAWIWTVATGTGDAWEAFLGLRVAADVDPTFLPLAVRIGRALRESTPKRVGTVGWHLPYVAESEWADHDDSAHQLLSAARCARVSVRPFDGAAEPEADVDLALRLIDAGHWSPFEHQATPSRDAETTCRNFRGWWQHRYFREEGRPRRRFDFATLDSYPAGGHFGPASPEAPPEEQAR